MGCGLMKPTKHAIENISELSATSTVAMARIGELSATTTVAVAEVRELTRHINQLITTNQPHINAAISNSTQITENIKNNHQEWHKRLIEAWDTILLLLTTIYFASSKHTLKSRIQSLLTRTKIKPNS